MFSLVDAIRENIPNDSCTDSELALLVGGSKDRRYGLVKRAVAAGKLEQVCRGVYVLAKKYQRTGINSYTLAGQIYGPSYISFESALSYHGWIPEAVYTITSATIKRPKTVESALGIFSYSRVPLRNAMQGVFLEENRFLMANPWKAILDYVYVNNPGWKSREDLMESLRIEPENLAKLPWKELEELERALACRRVSQFLKRIA